MANMQLSAKDLVGQMKRTTLEFCEKQSPKWSATIVALHFHARRSMVKLVRHGRSRYSRFEQSRGDGKPARVLSGLRPSLGRAFWPEHPDIEQLRAGAVDVEFKRPPKRTKTNAFYCLASGDAHGELVHTQLHAVCEFLNNGGPNPFDNPASPLDACVVDVLCALLKINITPLFSEYVVFDEALGVATAIDLIGLDMTPQNECFCVIELAMGYASVPFVQAPDSRRRLAEPLDFLTDTPAQRKFLQSWFGAEMLQRHYGVRNVATVLLRGNPHCNQFEVIRPKWPKQVSARKSREIYEALSGGGRC